MTLEKSILGMGNPLLDISAEVDDAFLAKYEVRRFGIENGFFFLRFLFRLQRRQLTARSERLRRCFLSLFDTEE